jgi:hypothetical protein
MALTLIKEDGTGRVDANSYASAADGDAYHDGHLYATAWAGATTGNKEKALVFATRLIDSLFQFGGGRTKTEQALQWPRVQCPDPDKGLRTVSALVPILDDFVPYDQVPKALVNATCEMARELLIADRSASPAGEGLSAIQSATAAHAADGSGSSNSSSTSYDKSDTRPIISHVAQAMLSKFGVLLSESGGSVRLVRS